MRWLIRISEREPALPLLYTTPLRPIGEAQRFSVWLNFPRQPSIIRTTIVPVDVL